MQWTDLHIANVRAAVDEVDEVLRALVTLEKQHEKLNSEVETMASTNKSSKSVSKKTEIEYMRKVKQIEKMASAVFTIVEAMKVRSMELKGFYDVNDLDPRAAPLESARLAIKRALLERGQSVPVPSSQGGPTMFYQPGAVNPRPVSRTTSTAGRRENNNSSEPENGFESSELRTTIHASDSNQGGVPKGRTPDSILLKVILTEEEFREVQRRRQAMQALLTETRK